MRQCLFKDFTADYFILSSVLTKAQSIQFSFVGFFVYMWADLFDSGWREKNIIL